MKKIKEHPSRHTHTHTLNIKERHIQRLTSVTPFAADIVFSYTLKMLFDVTFV